MVRCGSRSFWVTSRWTSFNSRGLSTTRWHSFLFLSFLLAWFLSFFLWVCVKHTEKNESPSICWTNHHDTPGRHQQKTKKREKKRKKKEKIKSNKINKREGEEITVEKPRTQKTWANTHRPVGFCFVVFCFVFRSGGWEKETERENEKVLLLYSFMKLISLWKVTFKQTGQGGPVVKTLQLGGTWHWLGIDTNFWCASWQIVILFLLLFLLLSTLSEQNRIQKMIQNGMTFEFNSFDWFQFYECCLHLQS